MNEMMLRIGDKVKINIAKENLDWGYGHDIHEKIGTVVGWTEIHYGYTKNYGKEPGIYENKSNVKVDIDGAIHCVSYFFLKELNLSEGRTAEEEKKIQDLPETDFWPGDIVEIMNHPNFPSYTNPHTINQINYHYIGKFCDDGITPLPIYDIDLSTGGTTALRESYLKLVSRGNVWKWYHKKTVTFNDINEEANFYMLIGRTKEIRNPRLGRYEWENEITPDGKPYPREALQAIENRLGHGLNVSNLFGILSSPHTSVIRFLDEEVGERVRKATLEGFGLKA